MSPNQSHLSGPKWGYDFTVSTTQASINAGLLQYLDQSDQPKLRVCYLANSKGQPGDEIAWDVLVSQTGVDPFAISTKEGDDYTNDKDIAKLTDARFMAGVELQAGLPEGLDLTEPQTVIDLGSDASNVTVNMFFKEVKVVSNMPGGWTSGAWEAYSQGRNDVWSLAASVDLKVEDLDSELNTPYFKNHPQQRDELKRQLINLSGMTFSLQQLLVDLTTATLLKSAHFKGIPDGSDAELVLQRCFVNKYIDNATDQGLPLVAVNAVSQDPDPSPLQITAYERQISPLKDQDGQKYQDPTPEQKAVTTMDYLCAANHNRLPGVAGFDWNWVSENEVGVKSGVISINRTHLGAFLLEQLRPISQQCCFRGNPYCYVDILGKGHFSWDIKLSENTVQYEAKKPLMETRPKPPHIINFGSSTKDYETYDARVTDQGDIVVSIAYCSDQGWEDKTGFWYAGLSINPNYTCEARVSGTKVEITQHIWVCVWAGVDFSTTPFNPVDLTVTDTYDISVDQYGVLQMTKENGSTLTDSHTDPNRNWYDFFTNIWELEAALTNAIQTMVPTSLIPIQFDSMQQMIFPGARVFTFKNVIFSDYQDIVSDITYIAPEQASNSKQAGKWKYAGTITSPWTRPKIKATQAVVKGRPDSKPPSAPIDITYSTELLHNYIRGRIVSPQGKFEAIQTDAGLSLVFSIDADGALLVFEETSGSSATGWSCRDISTDAITRHFPGGKVKTFDVGQSALDGSIGLLMAVDDGRGSDHVFLSLLNSPINTSWLANPVWILREFNADNVESKVITVRGAFFAEVSSHQYVVVDVDRHEEQSEQAAQEQEGDKKATSLSHIERYHIDEGKWVKHDVSVDIKSGDYQSCIGRVRKERVDGIYTKGKAGESAQLVYVPIVNVYGPSPPLPIVLNPPEGKIPSAIAAARNPNQEQDGYACTDLYIITDSTLYRLDDKTQRSQTGKATPLATDGILAGTTTLLTTIRNGVTTLWGKNGSNQVFYLSCAQDNLANPNFWSTPVLSRIEKIGAYMNRVNCGNNIFATDENNLYKLTQEGTSGNKLWRSEQIQLAANPTEPLLEITSFTTTIKVNEAGAGIPAMATKVAISANSRTSRIHQRYLLCAQHHANPGRNGCERYSDGDRGNVRHQRHDPHRLGRWQ